MCICIGSCARDVFVGEASARHILFGGDVGRSDACQARRRQQEDNLNDNKQHHNNIMYIHIYIYICIYKHLSLSLSVYIYIYMYTHIYISLSLYIYIYIYIWHGGACRSGARRVGGGEPPLREEVKDLSGLYVNTYIHMPDLLHTYIQYIYAAAPGEEVRRRLPLREEVNVVDKQPSNSKHMATGIYLNKTLGSGGRPGRGGGEGPLLWLCYYIYIYIYIYMYIYIYIYIYIYVQIDR